MRALSLVVAVALRDSGTRRWPQRTLKEQSVFRGPMQNNSTEWVFSFAEAIKGFKGEAPISRVGELQHKNRFWY